MPEHHYISTFASTDICHLTYQNLEEVKIFQQREFPELQGLLGPNCIKY